MWGNEPSPCQESKGLPRHLACAAEGLIATNYPQSNGHAEAAVKCAKEVARRTNTGRTAHLDTPTPLAWAIMQYLNTLPLQAPPSTPGLRTRNPKPRSGRWDSKAQALSFSRLTGTQAVLGAADGPAGAPPSGTGATCSPLTFVRVARTTGQPARWGAKHPTLAKKALNLATQTGHHSTC
ncbi:hypothetical protein GWK47_023816 [Chionoecetes opilio]|uniref:Uncharacterized protein n=1 Tax=Chionoecetes opilio TaxID=41210 RepID=A0A8J4XMP0_CHIOP|nr:hypothetical protein GWK47_023816 [Chionoecetes opilio]